MCQAASSACRDDFCAHDPDDTLDPTEAQIDALDDAVGDLLTYDEFHALLVELFPQQFLAALLQDFPTEALPGSASKITVLGDRAFLRLPLFHRHDAVEVPDDVGWEVDLYRGETSLLRLVQLRGCSADEDDGGEGDDDGD